MIQEILTNKIKYIRYWLRIKIIKYNKLIFILINNKVKNLI